MKFLSLLLIASALSFSASAQTTSDTTHHKMHHEYTKSRNHQWYTFFKDGSLMMKNNGTIAPVKSDVTLSNGTMISTTGKVTWKDGKTQDLQNGEMIDGNGKIHREKMTKMDNKK